MSHRIKIRKTGTEPNDLCPCNSGKKYKKCCGANITAFKGPKNGIPSKHDKIPFTHVDPAAVPGIIFRAMFETDKYTPEERIRLHAQRRLEYR